MDAFLGKIHTVLFKKWILAREYEGVEIIEENVNHVKLITDTCIGEVRFNELDIIELIVTNKIIDNVEFYIHFQMNNLHHSMSLFEEMMECIHKSMNKTTKKILLSCSSGFTTSMFAEKLNEAAKVLELDYEFNAVGFMDLFEEGINYDVVLLAPQISYQHAKAQQHLTNQAVYNIPPQIFAKYDANALFQFLEETHLQKGNKKEHTDDLCLPGGNCNDKVLSIVMSRPTPPQINISYRLVENGYILSENTIKVLHIDEQDMISMIDVLFAQYPDIKKVGISLPGIIKDGMSTYTSSSLNNIDILGPLKAKYKAEFILVNSVNSAAIGYHACQDKYKSLSVLSQAHFLQAGGVGHIVNGECLFGRNNMAGEIQFMPANLSEYERNLDGMLQFVAHYCLYITTMVAPEAIVVACPYILDKDNIINAMSTYLPTEFIPDIILVDDLSHYMHIGLHHLCNKSK